MGGRNGNGERERERDRGRDLKNKRLRCDVGKELILRWRGEKIGLGGKKSGMI